VSANVGYHFFSLEDSTAGADAILSNG